MGVIERTNTFLLKNYRILVVIWIFLMFLMSISLPIVPFVFYGGEFGKEINPTIVNGILTVTAIVFGFVAFELREIPSSVMEKFLLSLPLLLFLLTTLEVVFIGAIVGKLTSGVALVTTANCLFNILYILPVMVVKESRIEIEQRKKTEKQEREKL